MVREFLGYAEVLLLVSEDGELVPVLHCNQSIIEEIFSCIRGMGKDRTNLYASGVLQQNLNNNFKYNLKKNIFLSGITYGSHSPISSDR